MAGYTDTQIAVWLRGLLAIAWADGDFSTTERTAIIDLTKTELAFQLDVTHLDPISPDCPAFVTRCTPEQPLGAPMVSSEISLSID
jgi:hydrogenase maturation factor